MAQSVERILGKDEVPSSILGISTIKEKASLKREAFLHLSLSKNLLIFLTFNTFLCLSSVLFSADLSPRVLLI